jgi:hypothetical protein
MASGLGAIGRLTVDVGIRFDKKDGRGTALNTSLHAQVKECLVSRRADSIKRQILSGFAAALRTGLLALAFEAPIFVSI